MRSFLLWDTDAEIFPEGIRDKIFDTEIVAALVRTLGDSDFDAHVHRPRLSDADPECGPVEFFIVALAQGALLCCMGYYR